MKRRHFLQTLAAAPLVPVAAKMPVLAATPAVLPITMPLVIEATVKTYKLRSISFATHDEFIMRMGDLSHLSDPEYYAESARQWAVFAKEKGLE